MTTMKTLTLALALAVPSFASINYNSSKSNTGNVTVKNQTGQKTGNAKAASSHSNTQHN
ncbi:MAG: hypothetical protein ABSF12_06520 [Bryobacteraceae bacterium]|jgi:hypothetical protein